LSPAQTLIFAVLAALISGSSALAQTLINSDCGDQLKTAVSSISFRLDEKSLDDENSLIPIVAGQNKELDFTAAADILKGVAACFDADARISLRISVSSKSRFKPGPYFPGYHAQDDQSV
jgi:hypothetical protein